MGGVSGRESGTADANHWRARPYGGIACFRKAQVQDLRARYAGAPVGESRASLYAMQAVQTHSDHPHEHPFYWAAFVLLGGT